jgi:hypothetical protein
MVTLLQLIPLSAFRREYIKKTAIHSPNYTDGVKNRPVVEMLLPLSGFCSFGRFFLLVFRRDEKILKFVEITP